MESWCGGGLIHIHPVPSVLLGGVSWPPRGSLPASMAHTHTGICSACWLPGRVQIYFCLFAAHFLGVVPPQRDVSYTYKGVRECNRGCQGTTRKVHSLSVLMRPAHKQTHHLHYLSMRRLINMCIKHKAARRCTNSMLSLHPR